MNKAFILLIISSFAAHVFANEKPVKIMLTPYTEYILAGEVDHIYRDGSVGLIKGDLFGYGLGLKLGAQYKYVSLGADIQNLSLGTKTQTNSFIHSGSSYTAQNVGFYVGGNYKNVHASFSYYFYNSLTEADSSSYGKDEDGLKGSIGYLFKDKYLLSISLMAYEYTNDNLDENSWQIDIEEVVALNFALPLEILSF